MSKALTLILLAATLLLGLGVGPAVAQTSTTTEDESVLVRVNGDVTIGSGETHGVVVIIDGNLELDGMATTVVVINGDAALTGATIESLVVVSGTAILGPGTVVTGDVRLFDSTLARDETAIVEGDIDEGAGSGFLNGFWIVGLLFMIGLAVLVLLAGLLLAAVGGEAARRTGRTITDDLGPTIIAGLILWVVVPIVGILAFATIVGIPTALAIWLILLPALGFVGFLVAGIRIGESVTAGDGDGVGHPYLAALLGLLALIIVGVVPILGPIIVTIAGFLGSGAIALHAYRVARDQSRPTDTSPLPAAG